MDPSLGADYFERLYARNDDPWGFATSPYEREKYRQTVSFLGFSQFATALEVGCSIGVLTAMLADRCDDLLAVDISERALQAARQRCAARRHVRFERMAFPGESPSGPFALAVVSEVGYYWSDTDLSRAIDRLAEATAGGTLELVHYLPKVDEYIRDGDAVHAAFLADPRFTRTNGARFEKFRIDVLRVRG